MSLANLLHMPRDQAGQAAFAFEHDQQHRRYAEAVKTPVHILDPLYQTNIPATNWHQNHQQMHQNLDLSLNIAPNQILQETNLDNAGDLRWWLFANHQEHYVANLRLP